MANPDPIRIISRVVLQRMGGSIASPAMTLWAASCAPDDDEGALNEVVPNTSLEDFAGEINSGNFQVRVFTSRAPNLTSLPGGLLEGLTDDSYCLATVYESIAGDEVPKYLGRVEEVSVSHHDGQTILTCDCGLVIWRHITDVQFGLDNGMLEGRFFGWMVNRIITALGAVAGEIQFPAIQYDDPRLSFAEHPERQICTGQEGATPTPMSHCAALAYGGGIIYACAQHYVLGYNTATHEWIYLGALTGMTALTGMDFCVVGLAYEAGPQLRALVEHIPVSITTGTSPNPKHSQCYEVTFAL